MTAQGALKTLRSSRGGLSVAEAKERLRQTGPNAIAQEVPISSAQLFFRQFASPFTLILLVAVIAGAYLGEWLEAGLVVLIILLNGTLGYLQEGRADRALFALKQYLPQRARVRRDGQAIDVAAREVVPGDVMLLRAGDRVMADARILSADMLFTDESVLTGESQPTKKTAEPAVASTEIYDRQSMVFAGTSIAAGVAEVLVVATGAHTQFGTIADLATSSVDLETPFEHELRIFSRDIAKAAVVVCAVVFVLGLISGVPAISMVALSASLAVAIVPEGLQVAMTVILAVGMQRMLKRRVLVRTLSAVETLGGVHVLCVDKTGTLTTGQMSVTEVYVGLTRLDTVEFESTGDELIMALRILTEGDYSPTFTISAIRSFVEKFTAPSRTYPILVDVPFSPTLRYSARVVADGEHRRAFLFGASDALLGRVDRGDEELRQMHALVDDMAKRGLRTLIVAETTSDVEDVLSSRGPHDLQVLGFIGLSDPIRPSVAPSVSAARQAGIRTIMITGDHPETARVIAEEAGILTPDVAGVMTGSELAAMGDVELGQRILETAVFARVLPEQKLRLVQTLQAHHQVVAMTGDGINDAPALRAADVGIAVGHATDIARETADIVLLESDFSTIISAVEEGRAVFENIRKQVGFLMSFSLSETLAVMGAVVLNMPLPLLPLHILWLNVVTDSLPGMALAFEPIEGGVMGLAPRPRGSSLISGGLGRLMALSAAVTGLAIIVFLLGLQLQGEIATIRTWSFAVLGLSGVALAFVFRVFRAPLIFSRPWRNKALVGLCLVSILGIVLPIATPLRRLVGFVELSLADWGVVLGFVLVLTILLDLSKVAIFRRQQRLSVLSSSSIWISRESKASKMPLSL